jgi:hypothetical protein
MMRVVLALLLSIPALVLSHGSMNQPGPRQMRGLKADGSDCDPKDFNGNKDACRTGCIGEACNWFTDGSFIGCDTASNEGDWNDDCTENCFGHFKENGCTVDGVPTDHPSMPAEVLPHEFKTYDLRGLSPSWGVTGQSMTQNKPWTAPGHSPITNPCGIASGVVAGLPGGGDGHGKNPPVPKGATKGMNGTDLKPLDTPPTQWKAGSEQEVAWSIIANHGGGYQYRLCPKNSEPTEACFQSTPLLFVGNTTTIRMVQQAARAEIPDFEIAAMDVNIGTKPTGSFWRRNPIPACNCDLGFLCGSKTVQSNGTKPWWIDPEAKTKTPACPTGTQFEPPHPSIYGYSTTYQQGGKVKEQDMAYSLVDKVQVPEQKGEYILSFRWDCEQTAQVWNSCADIEVV